MTQVPDKSSNLMGHIQLQNSFPIQRAGFSTTLARSSYALKKCHWRRTPNITHHHNHYLHAESLFSISGGSIACKISQFHPVPSLQYFGTLLYKAVTVTCLRAIERRGQSRSQLSNRVLRPHVTLARIPFMRTSDTFEIPTQAREAPCRHWRSSIENSPLLYLLDKTCAHRLPFSVSRRRLDIKERFISYNFWWNETRFLCPPHRNCLTILSISSHKGKENLPEIVSLLSEKGKEEPL